MVVANVRFPTKLLVPRKGENVICRQRLIDLLHSNIHLPVQIVYAPAGYGKTTLLIDFVNDLDVPVCWYSLDTSDQDPRLLLEGIMASIRFHFPNFGQLTESRLLAAKNVVREGPELVGTLTGEMYVAIPDFFIFVLEDYHLIEDNQSARTLISLLVDRAPDNCHIIVSSRNSVELPGVSTLALQHRVARLSTSHLSFTPIEVKELLTTHYGLQLSDEEAKKIASDTEGWVIGILLRSHGLREEESPRDVSTISQRDVFRYLTFEVLERQPSEIQSFLLASSTLDDMKPESCDRLCGINNSRALLHQIETRNLFIHCVDDEKAWYRYHHLFREFLQAKLLEEYPEQFMFLHTKAASFFEQEQQWNEAITHFLTARRYDKALRVIKGVAQDSQNSGKWVTVSKWVEALPKSMRLSDPDLALINAQYLIHLGEVDEAIHVLTNLLREISTGEDWLHRAKALSWRSAAFRLTGLFTEAKRDVEVAIRLLKQHSGPVDILGDAYNRLGNIHAEQGRFILALRNMRQALKQYSSIFSVSNMAAVHNSLGITYKRLGDLTKANMHFEHAMEGWQKTNDLGNLASTLNNMGTIYQRWGQYDLALNTLRHGLEKARQTGYRRTEACILINLAEVLRDLDLYDEALAAYQEGLELARQVMETYFVAWATAGIGETYRLLGDTDKAEVLLKEAAAQAEEHGQTYEASLFATQLGIIEYGRGQYETATRILLATCERLRNVGDKDALARAYFHLAQASFLSTKYDLAINWLEKVSGLADELGYDHFLSVEARNAALLIQYAASKGVGGNRFVRIMDNMRPRRDRKRIQIPANTSIGLSVATKPDIKAYTLGETRVVSSHTISDSEWRSNRAKELFFYLLTQSTGQTKEQITGALWPDLAPAKATSNFHINLYRARRAISPSIFLIEEGRYKVNPHLNIWFDIAEFDSLLSQAENRPHSSKAKLANLEQAIEIYRGPFMKEFYGEWIELLRRELEDKYLRALSSLVSLKGDRGEHEAAIVLLEKYLVIDPYYDEVYCQIMEQCLALEDKASALRTYRRYIDGVASELGVSPPARMEELHKHI